MRIGIIASGTKYRMDEQFQNLLIFGMFKLWNFGNLLIFQFVKFQKFLISKIS